MKTSLADLAAYQQAARTQRNASDQLKAGGVEAAAKAFEAMFIKMLLGAMPESEDSAISGGFGGGVWRDMLHQEYASQASKQKGFGIAEAIVPADVASSSGHPHRALIAAGRALRRTSAFGPRAPDHRSTPPPHWRRLCSADGHPGSLHPGRRGRFCKAPKGAMASWLSCVTQTVRRRATRTLID